MQELCHRCHGELPINAAANHQSSDDAMLFCPRCSAPQIRLPEHMRSESDAQRDPSTGAAPPPRIPPAGLRQADSRQSDPQQLDPRQIDWRPALSAAGMVALVATGLRLVAMKFDFVSIVWFFWLLAGANLALSLYARKRPTSRMDARVGMRIGLVTGLLMCVSLAVVSGAAGVIVRYKMHGMESFDQQSAAENKVLKDKIVGWMQQQNFDAATQKNYVETMNSPLMNSPEMKAGSALAGFGLEGLVLIFVCGGIGAINGMMRGARLARQSGGS